MFTPQWAGPEMGSRSGGIWEAQASKPGSPDRPTNHTPMRTPTQQTLDTCITPSLLTNKKEDSAMHK